MFAGRRLYTDSPSSVVITATKSIIKIVFMKLKSISFRFASMTMFKTLELRDISEYPTIREYVPRYRGKKYIDINKSIAETA